jgi:hypothetical protein
VTCFASVALDDRVEVLVDSATVNAETLALESIIPKVIHAGKLPLVVAGRGPIVALSFVAQKLIELSACGSVDDTLAAFQTWLAEQRDAGTAFPQGCDLLLAGIRDDGTPVHYAVILTETPGSGLLDALYTEPWTITVIPKFYAGTPLDGADFAAAGLRFEHFDEGLREPGVRLMQAARAKELEWNGKPLVACGGTLMLVTVRAGGVTYEPLGMWPDMVGRPLERDAGWVGAS